MRNFLSILFVMMLSALLLIGCSSSGSDQANEPENTDEGTEEASEFPLEVTDAADNDVTIASEPENIVSLIPSNTEIAYALGLGDKMVGGSDYDNYPEEAEELEKVGGLELNVEKIMSLDPDLVLAHASALGSQEGALQQLRDSDITVYVVTDATSIEETYTAIEEIGKTTGAGEQTDQVISDMKDGFAELEDKTAEIKDEDRKSVFMETSPEPEIFTAGANTFWQELLDIVHAENAAGDEDGWVQLDPEAIVELNPDVILTTYGSYVDNPVEQVLERDGFGEVTAVKEEQVYDIQEDIVSRPGPRLVEGAVEIAKAVYPKLYEE